MSTETVAAPVLPRSTTRRTLWWLRIGLLTGAVVVLATSLATFLGVRASVAEVRERTAPAVLDVSAARAALVQAHKLAVAGFGSGQARLVGPGERYEDQIALASQQLTQVAEHNAAGEEGSGKLQLVEGLLPAYNGFIGQADVHYRAEPTGPLGASDLLSAANLLQDKDNGILLQLDQLGNLQRAALHAQLGTGWLDAAITLLWAVPLLALLAGLLWGQRFLTKRFRRTTNPALLLATVLLVLLGAGSALLLGWQGDARGAGTAVEKTVGDQDARSAATVDQVRRSLASTIVAQCTPAGQDACGDTVTAFAAGSGDTGTGQAVTEWRPASAVGDGLADPWWSPFLGYGGPVVAVVVGLLAWTGLQKRLDEYRFSGGQRGSV